MASAGREDNSVFDGFSRFSSRNKRKSYKVDASRGRSASALSLQTRDMVFLLRFP